MVIEDLKELINKVSICNQGPAKIAGSKNELKALEKYSETEIKWIDEEGVYPRRGTWLGHKVEEWKLDGFVAGKVGTKDMNIIVISEA